MFNFSSILSNFSKSPLFMKFIILILLSFHYLTNWFSTSKLAYLPIFKKENYLSFEFILLSSSLLLQSVCDHIQVLYVATITWYQDCGHNFSATGVVTTELQDRVATSFWRTNVISGSPGINVIDLNKSEIIYLWGFLGE